MLLPEFASSFAAEHVKAIAASDPKRPSGMVDWMHYGFLLRYRPECASPVEEHWNALEGIAGELIGPDLAMVRHLFEERSWSMGGLSLRKLAEQLWSEASRLAQGRFLAGLASSLNPGIDETVSWMMEYLPDCDFDPSSAAEVGANAAASGQVELLRRLLDHRGLPTGPVPRLTGYREQEGFEKQIEAHSTRLLDVMLEAAVRMGQAEPATILLERGATPNIPCWNLERSYQEWYSALSYAVDRFSEADSPGKNPLLDVLLNAGADPRGLWCEEKNKPLFLAVQKKDWALVQRLLALGARFEGGAAGQTAAGEGGESTVIAPRQPFFGFFDGDLDWIKDSIRPLVSLPDLPSTPYYYCGNGQGGSCRTVLECFVYDDDLDQLQEVERAGLSVGLSVPEFAAIVYWGAYDILRYLLRDHPQLARVIYRIRRHKPEFGASRRQLILGRPEEDRRNRLADFNAHGQPPLLLPDGGKVYVYLDAVALPDHQHGPITEGCFWLEKVTADFRRRTDHIEVQNVRRIWRMEAVPTNEYQIKPLLPLVRETDGTFYWLGLTLNALTGQSVPEDFRKSLHDWWDHIRQVFIERGKAQKAANRYQPKPVLSEEELEGYPREFWPWLRRLRTGHVGMTKQSCASNPDILEIYEIWERQNKPDYSRRPDPRCAVWPLWNQVPVEFRPYFIWSEMFGKPTTVTKGGNTYQNAMIRKALNWSNQQFIDAVKRHETGDAEALAGWTIDPSRLNATGGENR